MSLVKVGRVVLYQSRQPQTHFIKHDQTYPLVPSRIRKRDQITIGLLRPSRFRRTNMNSLRGLCLGCLRRGRSRSRSISHFLGVQRPNLQLRLVLLQNPLIVIFPELFRGVFPGDFRKD